jgi:hypothetical protein
MDTVNNVKSQRNDGAMLYTAPSAHTVKTRKKAACKTTICTLSEKVPCNTQLPRFYTVKNVNCAAEKQIRFFKVSIIIVEC